MQVLTGVPAITVADLRTAERGHPFSLSIRILVKDESGAYTLWNGGGIDSRRFGTIFGVAVGNRPPGFSISNDISSILENECWKPFSK